MQLSWRRLARLSCPRRWSYLFGPYLLGVLLGAREPLELAQPLVLLFAVFFLAPANLLLYGIGAVFDGAVFDEAAPPTAEEAPLLLQLVMAATLPFLLLLPLANGAASLAMLAFLFFALEYSAPPLSARKSPWPGAAFAVVYICPAVFGYFLAGGQSLQWPIVAAGWLWAMAARIYGTVPAIFTDRAAGTRTVATQLGVQGALGLCLTLSISAAVLALPFLGAPAVALGVLYAALMFLALTARTQAQWRAVNRWFHCANLLCGIALLLAVANFKWW